MPPRWRLSNPSLRILGGFTIFIATFICYWPALRGDFLWDDDRHVSQNRTLLDLNGLRRIWFRVGATPQYYPMTHTSFWIEYRFWKLDPLGYHVTNVLLHVTNALLLWALLERLKIPGAWLAATVFALHPVNVESVAWITERKNVLAMCFGLLSILAYLSGARRGYIWSIVLFACALLSKTVIATLPAAIGVILWWTNGRVSRRDLLKLAPMFALGIGLGAMTARMEHSYVGASGADWNYSLAQRMIIAGKAASFYAWKLIWPSRLTFSYPKWEIDSTQWTQWLCLAFVVIVVLVAMYLLTRSRDAMPRGIASAVLIYVGTLVPALGFLNTYPMRYSFVADHFQYLSAPALIALLAAGATRLRTSFVIIVITAVLGVLTWRQSHIYAGPVPLWRDTIDKNPSSWMAMNNLAVTLMYDSDRDRARGDEQAALQKLQEALTWFDRVETLRPTHERLQANRADTLAKLRRFDEAIAIYRRELNEKSPQNPDLLARFADVLEQAGRTGEEGQLRKELGLLLYHQARSADARPYLERAVQLLPDDAEAHGALGFVYGELGRFDDARREFNRTLEIDPRSPEAQHGLELLRRATGR